MSKRFALSAVILLISGILTVGMSAPASAHAALTDTNPKDGAVLTEVPNDVTFTFNEVLKEPGFAAVSLDGEEVSGWSFALDAEKLVVIPPQGEEVPGGDYVVSFRVVSADGHPIKGSTSFTLDIEDTAPADETDADEDTSTDESANGDTNSEDSGGLVAFLKAPWVWGGIVVIIAIVAAAVVRRRGTATNND